MKNEPLVNEIEETFINKFADEFPPWHHPGIQTMKNKFYLISLICVLAIKKLDEVADELRIDVNFQNFCTNMV